MRRIGGTNNGPDRYAQGVFTGAVGVLMIQAVVRAAQWAMSNAVVATVIEWATTPQIAPVDVVPFLVIALVIITVAGGMTVFGGVAR